MTREAPEFADAATSAEIARGATVKTVYVERQVTAFAVFETEVSSISSLNAQTTVFFSVGSALASFAIGIWTNALFNVGDLSPTAAVACKVVGPLLMVVSFIFFWLGHHAYKTRKTQVEEIRSQSKVKTA